MNHGYERSLLFVLRHRFSTLLLAFGLLGASIWLFIGMPKGFLPSVDSGVHQRHRRSPARTFRTTPWSTTFSAIKDIMRARPERRQRLRHS